MRAIAPAATRLPVTRSTRAWDTTSRSKVVSAVTREMRSPLRWRSYSLISSRSSRPTSPWRSCRTTRSPIRSRMKRPAAPVAASTTNSAPRSPSSGQTNCPRALASTTCLATSGWDSPRAEPTRVSAVATAMAPRCPAVSRYIVATATRAEVSPSASDFRPSCGAVAPVIGPSAVPAGRPSPAGRSIPPANPRRQGGLPPRSRRAR